MKAKLAWLCYTTWDDGFGDDLEIKFSEPEEYRYDKVIPIVYFEVEE